MGRFLNADAFAATGQGLLGNNMFAYCGNNPVLNRDTQGTRHEISAGAGGCFTNPGPTVSLGQIIKKKVTNEDPQITMDSLKNEGIGFYKGAPVIKVPEMGDASFSFGVIFMGEDVVNFNDINLLKHEYGHVIQLRKLGVSGYTKHVVLPSVTCFWATEAGLLHDDLYHSLPWEYIADRFGEVQYDYTSGATAVAAAYWCFAMYKSKIDLLMP